MRSNCAFSGCPVLGDQHRTAQHQSRGQLAGPPQRDLDRSCGRLSIAYSTISVIRNATATATSWVVLTRLEFEVDRQARAGSGAPARSSAASSDSSGRSAIRDSPPSRRNGCGGRSTALRPAGQCRHRPRGHRGLSALRPWMLSSEAMTCRLFFTRWWTSRTSRRWPFSARSSRVPIPRPGRRRGRRRRAAPGFRSTGRPSRQVEAILARLILHTARSSRLNGRISKQ